MIEILALEGQRVGEPLTSAECEILAGTGVMSEELWTRARGLIERVFEAERESESDPRNFCGSMEWASDAAWSNVVELTYQVVDGLRPIPRLPGWARVKDKIALVGCGFLVVLLMLAGVIASGFIFHWK